MKRNQQAQKIQLSLSKPSLPAGRTALHTLQSTIYLMNSFRVQAGMTAM